MENTEPQNLWEHAYKLIFIAIGQRIWTKILNLFGQDYQVSEKLLDAIYKDLWDGYRCYGYTDEEVFENFWDDFYPLLFKNRALCEFMFIGRAAHSRTYVNWVLTIMRDGNYALGMMAAVGQGLDYAGQPQAILVDDSFARGVAWGWTMGEAVHRQMIARTLMRKMCRIAILGAGYLPELSSVYGELPGGLVIDACDADKRIPAEALMEQYPHVRYVWASALEFLENSKDSIYDGVFMPGVMSYNMLDFNHIFQQALRVLKPGGTFLFDMQVLHPELVMVKLVYHWGEGLPNNGMKLMSAKKTISYVEKTCAYYNANFNYSSSGHYKSTSAISFIITKPKDFL